MENITKKKITLLGGDIRMLAAASRFSELGYTPSIYGIDLRGAENIHLAASDDVVDSGCCSSAGNIDGKVMSLALRLKDERMDFAENIENAVTESEAVILPLPVSSDGENISTPLDLGCKIKLSELARILQSAGVKLVCGGKMPPELITSCSDFGLEIFDYYEREEFAVANAVPTAEGAIEIAMRELPITLHGARALVIGYGRIGKVLARLLKSLGAKVTVSARKKADFTWIDVLGADSAETMKLPMLLQKNNFDVIFNTVPRVVLDRSALFEIAPDAVIIDLASKPGGVDVSAAKDRGVNVIWALSLPGKVAPVTAGRIIADTVSGYMQEKGGI